jgi:deoxyribodipyrimidine photolyase-related protein
LGTTDGFDLAVTHEHAQQAAHDFFDRRLPDFGAYEDAMSSIHRTLYHSRLSPYLNLGLLDPLELAREAERRYLSGKAPLNSVEGFIRQVIGWREFIYWQYWHLTPGYQEENYWAANRPLPDFFWDGQTDLNCLGKIIHRALQVGYTHHIERLMVLCNFCQLAGINPAAVNDWFLSAYIDAYEWVMLPNVIGMGLYADGGQVATKPYIASANYINKMSDYCRDCTYDRKERKGERACPFNFLYWNFILQHETALRKNPRMNRSLLGLRHLDPPEQLRIQQQAAAYLNALT